MTAADPRAPARIARAYLTACRIELQSLKPGNVHVFADGHRMTVDDFEASAAASAPVIADPTLAVGERIYQAVQRTRDAVHSNTNLGIVLLCAPLAAAAQTSGMAPISAPRLRTSLRRVLGALDVADAERAFAAIRLAAPAGLGGSAEHDVNAPARVPLLEAMIAAQDRDRIAAQYATGFADVFELGVPRLAAGLARWSDIRWAATSTYLGLLAAFADSHVVRKHGTACAERMRRAAAPLDAELLTRADPAQMDAALMAFDTTLKVQGINPGTSADLTVASLFVHLILHGDDGSPDGDAG
jgi:triphosphoribosyl-dephospho-CoA synthase